MARPLTHGSFLEQGKVAWPSLEVNESAFLAHVARLEERHGRVRIDNAGDLYLAFACGVGASGALEAFEEAHRSLLERATGRAAGSKAAGDDAAQALRIKLFVEAPPKILQYSGQSRLGTWLTTAAVRAALNLRRRRDERREDDGGNGEPIAHASPEARHLLARYKGEFESAVKAALEKLTERQRLLLVLHLGKRMTIDDIGDLYRVGRSTAARWIASAREALAVQVRSDLKERHGLSTSEFDSVAAAVRSQVEVSIVRLIEEKEANGR